MTQDRKAVKSTAKNKLNLKMLLQVEMCINTAWTGRAVPLIKNYSNLTRTRDSSEPCSLENLHGTSLLHSTGSRRSVVEREEERMFGVIGQNLLNMLKPDKR